MSIASFFYKRKLPAMANIRKPDIDEREYRLITLRNNLEAMIISDPKANQCKISLV